jgi:hypothetical protein
MKTYLSDLIPKIQRFSQKLDDITKLTNQHWVSIGEINQTKRVYIFRSNNQLLISDNGIVEKGSWEYIDNQTILMETKSENYLLNQGFFDGNILVLKLDGTDSYAFFVNETKSKKEIKSVDDVLIFLEKRYLLPIGSETIPTKSVGEGEYKIGYQILRTYDDWVIGWGKHTSYVIRYSNGYEDEVYKMSKSGKYFFYTSFTGLKYGISLEDVIYKLFFTYYRRQRP